MKAAPLLKWMIPIICFPAISTLVFGISNPSVTYYENQTNVTLNHPDTGESLNVRELIGFSCGSFSGCVVNTVDYFENQTGSYVKETICSGNCTTDNPFNISLNRTISMSDGVLGYVWMVTISKSGIGNWTPTNSTTFKVNIGNQPPHAEQVNISPVPIVSAASCVYAYVDPDGNLDNQTSFKWYNQTGLIISGGVPLTNKTIFPGNISNSAYLTCEVTPSDGFLNGTPVNSSTVVMGDSVPPSLNNASVSPSSIYIGSTVTFQVNASDSLSSLAFVYLEVENPNGDKSNYSMTLAAGQNAAANQTQWTKTYTPGLIGTYYGRFYAQDSSGNLNATAYSSQSFSVSSMPVIGGGGGGGGSSETIIVESGNKTKPILEFESSELDFVILRSPKTIERILPVYNAGDSAFFGYINVSEGLAGIMRAEACSVQTGACSVEDVTINAGENYNIRIIVGVPEGYDEKLAGSITLANEDGTLYQVPVTIEPVNKRQIAIFAGFLAFVFFIMNIAGVRPLG